MHSIAPGARLIALIVCDTIHVERDGHKTVAHMMSMLRLECLPAAIDLTLFARYTVSKGSHNVSFRFIDPSCMDILKSQVSSTIVSSGSPPRELILRSEVNIVQRGNHEVQLIIDDQIVGVAPIMILSGR